MRSALAAVHPPQAHRDLGWLGIGLYGVPAVAIAAPVFFVQFYFLSFATDVLLLAPVTVGGILAAGRVWDAVSDPLAGYGSDRTRSRWGRRRPWMLLAAPVSGLAFAALWNPPSAFDSPRALPVWCAFWLFALTAAVTAWGIPHQALGAELSDDPHTRHRIFGVRFVTSLAGVALSFGGMQLVGNAEDPRAAASSLSWAMAAAMAVLLAFPAVALRERSDRVRAGMATPLRAARDVVGNADARRLLAVWFIAQLGMVSQGVVAPYMSTYVMKRPDLIGILPALFIGPLVASVPVWIALAHRFGAKRVWRASMFAGAAAYSALFWLPADGFAWIALLLGAAGFLTGCGGPLGPAFLASVADAESRRTGERREGIYFAAKEFVEKASGAAVALVAGVVLQLSGFVPNAEQEPGTLIAIRACLSFLPGATFFAGAVLLGGFQGAAAPASPGSLRRAGAPLRDSSPETRPARDR
jgi:GPH family glycoside/pentoside/hexuronide:cation symporter